MAAGKSASAAVSVLCAALCGCASINVSRVGKVMVDVENTNWLLFNFIPLASGNPERPNANDCRFFRDTVNLANNIDMVDRAVRENGAVGVRDLVSYTTDEYVLFVLLKHHAMHTSAELVMPGDETRGGEVQKVESRLIREERMSAEPPPESPERVEAPSSPVWRPGGGLKLMDF